MSYTDVCRTCLEIIENGYFIQDYNKKGELNIMDMLSFVMSSKIELGEEYPDRICQDCFLSIQSAYNFILRYKKCQQKLKVSLDQLKKPDTKPVDENDDCFSDTKGNIEGNIYFDYKVDDDNSQDVKNTITEIKEKRKAEMNSIEYECSTADETGDSSTRNAELFNVTVKKYFHQPKKKYHIKNICPVCCCNVTDFKELEQHLLKTHKSSIFTCNLCKRKSKYNSTRYIQHLSKNHVFYCTVCKISFSSYATLYYHLKVKHTPNKSLYKCDKCSKSYPIKSLMTSHKKTHVTGEKYLCNKCGISFQTYKTYNHHNKQHDESWNSKKYKCEVCDQTFALRFGLHRHMLKHSEVDNFLCNKCGKGFKTYDTYNYHRKTHDNTRNHVCSVCGKAFLQAVHLKEHSEKHVTLKSFRCEICDKEYSGTSSLRKHKRIYHAAKKVQNKND